jgi:hypothetical protein
MLEPTNLDICSNINNKQELQQKELRKQVNTNWHELPQLNEWKLSVLHICFPCQGSRTRDYLERTTFNFVMTATTKNFVATQVDHEFIHRK